MAVLPLFSHGWPWQRAGHDETFKASVVGKNAKRVLEVSKPSVSQLWQKFLIPAFSQGKADPWVRTRTSPFDTLFLGW